MGPSSASLVHGASLTSEVSLWFVVGLSCGVGATRDGPMRPATRGSSLTTKQQGALERSVMFSASRSKPRFFALLCGVSLVSPPCGSKPLLQLTAGTERACGSVWLVIRPQAKIRVRALSCVHITSQGPRPSLCRVHTVGVLGALGSEISSQEATNFYEMPAVRVSAARDVATSQTALSARVPARTKLGRGRRTQAEANARTTAACVKRTFQSDSPSKSPSSDCISHNQTAR